MHLQTDREKVMQMCGRGEMMQKLVQEKYGSQRHLHRFRVSWFIWQVSDTVQIRKNLEQGKETDI